jgi:tetratricopeptide (TPR) repeat protein
MELKSTPADARRIWERIAAATGVDQPEYWRAVGEIALLDQEWDKAVLAFKQGIALSTDPYDLYLALARAQVAQRDFDGAISSYRAAVQLHPQRSVEVYVLAADIELQRGNYPGCAAWCEWARQSFPNSHVPDRTQGIAAWRLGKWEEAERLLLGAHQKDSNDPYPLYYLALTQSAQGRFAAAARYMEQATVRFVESYPLTPPPCDWFRIAGELYWQVNDLEGAKSMYQQGLVHCPQEQIFSDRLRGIGVTP